MPMASEKMRNTSLYQKQSLSWKIWNWFGFGYSYLSLTDVNPDESKKGFLAIDTFFHFDLRDRLRILVSGKAMVSTLVGAESPIVDHVCKSKFRVLPPTYRFSGMEEWDVN